MFTAYADNSWEVYTIHMDGSHLTRLTDDDANDDGAHWSQNDGANQTNLTNHAAKDYGPVWLPGMDRITFVSKRGGNWDIYTMAADGSDLQNITNHPADDGISGFSWSSPPDRLAFSTNRDGNWEVYWMKADGSNLTNLSNHGARDTEPRLVTYPRTGVETMASQ